MVSLRGTNCSVNSMPHGCVNHGNQSQQGSIDLTQGLQTSLNMSQPGVAQHMNANQLNGPSLSNVSVQFVPQQNNTNSLKHDRAPSQYANSNCMPSSHHYRLLTQSRPECYHPSGAAGGGYMSSGAGGGQGQSQPTLRVQPNPQPSAPPAPQQDMSKTSMSGHNFVAPQNSTPASRPQYPNFPYRPNQHGSRSNTHQRPQQTFMPNASATASPPVMYHPPTLVFQPHMVPPSYQQSPRSTTPGYYQYVPQSYISYSTPASHTPPYYYSSNNQPLPGQNLPNNTPGGRNNPTTLVGPQGTPVTATAPTASIPHSQPPGHMHQQMPGIRQAPTKRSRRVPIIDPVTQQDILSDLYSDNSQYLSGESSERQTPQPESTPSIAEEFTRMVNEVAKQPTTYESTIKASFVSKNTDVPISSTSNATPQNAIISNNIIVKAELNVNEKCLGPDVAVESNDTPIVSAISDSPVIVPKMPINIKQIPKISESLPVAIDTNKNITSKQQKQNRSKPVVPQGEDAEKSSENAIYENVALTGLASAAPPLPQPQPQRIREPRDRLRSEEKEKDKSKVKDAKQELEAAMFSSKLNGPSPFAVISSVDNLSEIINLTTSPSVQQTAESSKKQISKQVPPVPEIDKFKSLVTNFQVESKNKIDITPKPIPPKPLTATELLSASIEKFARLPLEDELEEEKVEVSSAIQAQAKLTQSIVSCIRNHQPDPNMKDINLNKTSDPDTANANNNEITITETVEEDIDRNEKVVNNNQNNKKATMMANDESVTEETCYENGTEEETDTLSNTEQDTELSNDSEKDESEAAGDSAANMPSTAFVPKYKYTEDQWSPINKSGKKTYDISLLKQIKEDPLSKNKPTNAARLEACNVLRASPLLDTPLTFTNISRPANDSLFPNFFPKSVGVGPRNAPRDAKKDSRNMAQSGKGSVKLQSPGGGGSTHKPVIHVSLSLREEVKLNQSKDAWKPGRFKKENLDEEEIKTQELYRKFRGILNKLTPQKFDTLLERVKSLEINNQKRLEGVIDLVFEKAIDEPNFSEAYAAMCNKLSVLKVPADNAPADQCVNFRALIINKCQNQFVTEKVDEQILKLEKDYGECSDPTKKRELQLMINEENRRVRMRSVGNVRFIGELYKLKMLTAKIMVFCMNYLIEKLEEEKLECLCKLLTTIGEQVESEVREQLDTVFKKMQDIIDRKTNKISSRVRFMIQDVIELRRRRWVAKNVVDLQPKMMDQIQKEAEQQQRHIELMNATPMGGFRRDDGGRGKRGGDSRRQGSNFNDNNNWKTTRTNYVVDTSKLLKVTQKNIGSIKLAPQNLGWNHGSGTKNTAQTTASNSMISLTKNNMYSMLENVQTDPATLRSNKDATSNYSKGASIERSTFNSRGDFSSDSRSGSVSVAHSTSGTRTPTPPTPPAAVVPQEPLPDSQRKTVQSVLDLWIMNNPGDDADLAAEVKHLFKPQYHASVVTQILNVAIEKSVENNALIAKSLAYLVSSNIIAPDNVVTGLAEVLEVAPDLYIDIPLLYDNLAKFIAPHIEKKHITFAQIFSISEAIVSANQSHLLLKAIIRELKDSMGPSFVRSKWQESGLQLKKWMNADQVPKWLEDNNFEFLEGETNVNEDAKNILSPSQTQSKLLQLMNADESCECIKGWVQDNLGKAANEDWFMRALIQAICEHALFGAEGRDVPHFNQDRMNKYCGLIEFGDSRQAREASCLFGIQQLIHRLEHPQGITLEIFQYLHEQYIINVEGFIAWEISKDEPEGKAVMLKALTSFFTNIKEANEDSCSED